MDQAKPDRRMLWLHLAGLRWRPGVSKGVEAETVPGGLIMPEGREIEVDTTYREDATAPTRADAPVAKALARAIKRVTAKEAMPMGIGGGTGAAFFRRVGLPAAVWSTVSDTAHQPNEYCLISSLITDAKIFACLYLDEVPT